MTDAQPIAASMPAVRRQLVRCANTDLPEPDPLVLAARHAGLRRMLDASWLQVIPSKYVAASWDQILDPRAKDRLRAWSKAKDGTNLVVVGPWGTGKTSGAVLALRAAHDAGFEVRFVDVRDLMTSLHPGGPEGILEEYISADRLLIDDVGHEVKSAWTTEQLDHIISARYNEQRPTVVTSNLNFTSKDHVDLESHLGGHAASRLTGEGARLVTMRGPDRRRNQ